MKFCPLICILILTVTGVGPGCVAYRFNVDAVRAQTEVPVAHSYVIVNANPEIGDSDLRYLEAVAFLRTALSGKGLYQAPDGMNPDIVIEFDFGMEPRSDELLAFSRPGSWPVATTASQPPARESGRGRDQARRTIIPVGDPLEESIRVMKVTSYPKYLRITAREGTEGARDNVQRELWSVFVSNRDEDNDLRKYLPLMISAALDSLSIQTEPDHVVVLRPDDQRVAFVRSAE